VKRQAWLRLTMLTALALAAGLALLRPHALWAQADQPQAKVFLALSSGSQENPPVDTPAVAFARFVVSADRTQMFYEISMAGLKGTFAAMHLHRGRAGQNGPVVYPITTPPVNGVAIGIIPFNPTDFAELTNQGFYFNIHSSVAPAGEIRSQVLPAPSNLSPSVNP
jgi:hypothetical protein